MTTVYLDTSVAINESFLMSPYSEAFLKACAILQYTVVVPEIVLDELRGNFPKKLQEKYLAFLKAKKELQKLIEIDGSLPSLPEAVVSFDGWLDQMMDDHGVVTAPYPEVPIKELVEQSYAANKPFKDSGEGHKDYIVWKTILTHIVSDETSHPNIFLTNNTKDFCAAGEGGASVLHPDLAQQIEHLARRPRIYTSIKGAFDAELSPNLEGITLDDIPDLGADDVDTLVGKFLLDDLPGRTLYGLEGVPFGNDISLSSIGHHSIDSVSLKRVDNEVVINVTGSVEVEVDGFIDKSEYYGAEDGETNMYVIDGNWNDHVMMVSSTVETYFEMTIFYSTETSQVTGREITLPEEVEDEWPYK